MPDTFVEELRQALEKSGLGRIRPDDEFEAWCKASDEYWDSPEGRAQTEMEGAVLTYYLDKIAKYKFTDAMGEISGFGGDYEKACRVMLDSGLQWFDANTDADPRFKGCEGVYGVLAENNEDAKALSDVVTKHVDGCTGAMHQAVISSCLFIKKEGWDKYVDAMSKEDSE